jgi:hypothetical protein
MKVIQKLIFLLFLILMNIEIYAQGPPPPPPPPGLSLDGGVFVLLASAVYYGIKKLVY